MQHPDIWGRLFSHELQCVINRINLGPNFLMIAVLMYVNECSLLTHYRQFAWDTHNQPLWQPTNIYFLLMIFFPLPLWIEQTQFTSGWGDSESELYQFWVNATATWPTVTGEGQTEVAVCLHTSWIRSKLGNYRKPIYPATKRWMPLRSKLSACGSYGHGCGFLWAVVQRHTTNTPMYSSPRAAAGQPCETWPQCPALREKS